MFENTTAIDLTCLMLIFHLRHSLQYRLLYTTCPLSNEVDPILKLFHEFSHLTCRHSTLTLIIAGQATVASPLS